MFYSIQSMPFGSILHIFDYISLTTADDVHVQFKNTYLSRLAFRLLGIPHVEFRLRARKIMQNIPMQVTRMFDAGFGTGVYCFTLAGRIRNIHAIDIDNTKVDYAKRVNTFRNICFQTMDLTKLAFPDCSFDLIICSDVLEHIKLDELAFFHLARILKKDGTLLITTPYDCDENRSTYKQYHHERPGYNESRMQDLCAHNGLIVEKSEGYSYLFAHRAYEMSRRIYNKKLMLALFFLLIYPLVLVSESLFPYGDPNGIFFRITKK
jgi:2-polyprenyl-3-methyl-5-hydroxy-6-metoxy-1,4-benzoquinol methylase